MDSPMPQPTNPPALLKDYKVLCFDVYGTLVEYKAFILMSFQPLLARLPSSSPYLDSTPISTASTGAASVGSIEFLKVFQKEEDTIKLEKPVKRFDAILSEIWSRVARRLEVHTTEEEARAFGSEATIASWPCFPGTVDALKRLSRHYHLIALSNIDSFAWSITRDSQASRLGEVDWWKVFTADDFEDDASRTDEIKLETATNHCEQNGFSKDQILHVAQSLGHDQAPAKRLGIGSVWLIGDGPKWGKEAESKMALEKNLVGYAWRCQDLREFCLLVEREFETKSS